MSEEYDYLFKILLIGNSTVSNESLLHGYVENVGNDSSTIGVDIVRYNI